MNSATRRTSSSRKRLGGAGVLGRVLHSQNVRHLSQHALVALALCNVSLRGRRLLLHAPVVLPHLLVSQTKPNKEKKKVQAGSDCIRKGVRDETGKAKQSKAKQSKAKQSKAKQSKAKISKTLTSCNLLNKAVASCSESRYILYVRSAVTIW